jgi:nicotinamide-nucleotide amidase
MKAALIATGNEVVAGQIVNTNASLLANLLSGQGVEVLYHLAVKDREEDLVDGLNWLKEKGVEHVFTIGGLGPTRDDLTRKIVAEYLGKDFTFKEDLWFDLKSALENRDITPREGHKWQCYFPDGALVLTNSKGTADGFKTDSKELTIWCLPGPPYELLSVFENGVKTWLDEHVHGDLELLTWQCIGVPESELAYDVEKELQGCSYEIGYRASPPMVEVKMWVPLEDPDKDKWVEKVEKVVEKDLYSRQGQNYLKEFFDSVLEKEQAIDMIDDFSEGDLFADLNKSYDGKIPKGLGLAFGNFEASSKNHMFISQMSNRLEVDVKIGDRHKKWELPLDPEKAKKRRRYRVMILMEIFKKTHSWWFNN